jgi:hypothetical protein
MTVAYQGFTAVLLLIYGELLANNSWIFHHDNEPAHTTLSMREFLDSKQITVLEHPPYSQNVAPNDFYSSRR